MMNATPIQMPSSLPGKFGFRKSSFAYCRRVSPVKHRCFTDENSTQSTSTQGFSVLETEIQADIGNVWSSLGFYVFSIHIPLSFGGLSAVAKVLQQPVLDPQTEKRNITINMTFVVNAIILFSAQAVLILTIQILELYVVQQLLKFPGKPQYDILDFFHANKPLKPRSWVLASVIGFGFLVALVAITSYVADRSLDPKDVNDPILKEILSSSPISTISCILAYCIITPLLEEIVYRGFLITSLAPKMKWQQAVAISSIVFSAVHLSGENFLQYVAIGAVLGCSYCWTGNLSSSILTHSLYNALILYLTYIS